ncbi:SH3 domain-binding glutamic acid-rich protein homolog [Leptinotarsa decemlineata]|uniref:SH3 domain-binding glutamic acid-rich protein homolog n=1 Tax=Leptinotarsa decemlineata TaxID=7539 RepID=UPI000C25554C|nr:SH3 domain-binding glutamic acid-rich protein homolog [Leptinotarsa decemlineata]
MVIKVYISGISGNKEVKKRQQRVLLILDSKNVKYEVIDIAEPGAEEAKDFMQTNSTGQGGTISDPNPRHPLPPQIFNNDVYCGDYDMFDMANEIDEMEKFLKLEASDFTKEQISTAEINLKNGDVETQEHEVETEELKENKVPNQQVDENKVDEINSVESKEHQEETGENQEEEEEHQEKKEEHQEENEGHKENGAGDEQIENVEKSEKLEEEWKKEISPEKADE